MPLPTQEFGYPICYLSRSDLIYCADCAQDRIDGGETLKPFLLDGMDPEEHEVCSQCGEEF